MTHEEETKELLQKNLDATLETQRMFRQHIKWVRIWTVAKYLLITGFLAFALVKVLPFLEPLVDAMGQLFPGLPN